MKTLHFSAFINAPREKVWRSLWEDASYRNWTSAFSEGSYAVSDWKEGSKILFLSPGGEGMFSVIDKLEQDTFMSFKHLGVVKENKEQPETEATKKWSGAMENYTLKEKDGGTLLEVSVDMADDHVVYFEKAFPVALDKVRQIAES